MSKTKFRRTHTRSQQDRKIVEVDYTQNVNTQAECSFTSNPFSSLMDLNDEGTQAPEAPSVDKMEPQAVMTEPAAVINKFVSENLLPLVLPNLIKDKTCANIPPPIPISSMHNGMPMVQSAPHGYRLARISGRPARSKSLPGRGRERSVSPAPRPLILPSSLASPGTSPSVPLCSTPLKVNTTTIETNTPNTTTIETHTPSSRPHPPINKEKGKEIGPAFKKGRSAAGKALCQNFPTKQDKNKNVKEPTTINDPAPFSSSQKSELAIGEEKGEKYKKTDSPQNSRMTQMSQKQVANEATNVTNIEATIAGYDSGDESTLINEIIFGYDGPALTNSPPKPPGPPEVGGTKINNTAQREAVQQAAKAVTAAKIKAAAPSKSNATKATPSVGVPNDNYNKTNNNNNKIASSRATINSNRAAPSKAAPSRGVPATYGDATLESIIPEDFPRPPRVTKEDHEIWTVTLIKLAGGTLDFFSLAEKMMATQLMNIFGPGLEIKGRLSEAKKRKNIRVTACSRIQYLKLKDAAKLTANNQHIRLKALPQGRTWFKLTVPKTFKPKDHKIGTGIYEGAHVCHATFKETCKFEKMMSLKSRNGHWITSRTTALFSVEGQRIPAKVSIDGKFIDAAGYAFPASHCRNCCDYSHHHSKCKNATVCGFCAGSHNTTDCPHKDNRSKHCCKHCRQNHTVWSRQCDYRQYRFDLNLVKAGRPISDKQGDIELETLGFSKVPASQNQKAYYARGVAPVSEVDNLDINDTEGTNTSTDLDRTDQEESDSDIDSEMSVVDNTNLHDNTEVLKTSAETEVGDKADSSMRTKVNDALDLGLVISEGQKYLTEMLVNLEDRHNQLVSILIENAPHRLRYEKQVGEYIRECNAAIERQTKNYQKLLEQVSNMGGNNAAIGEKAQG